MNANDTNVLLGLIALLAPVSLIVQIWTSVKRKPPVDQDLSLLTKSLAQLTELVERQIDTDKTEHNLLHKRISEFKQHVASHYITRAETAASESTRSEDRRLILRKLDELTIAVADVAARVDERRKS